MHGIKLKLQFRECGKLVRCQDDVDMTIDIVIPLLERDTREHVPYRSCMGMCLDAEDLETFVR